MYRLSGYICFVESFRRHLRSVNRCWVWPELRKIRDFALEAHCSMAFTLYYLRGISHGPRASGQRSRFTIPKHQSMRIYGQDPGWRFFIRGNGVGYLGYLEQAEAKAEQALTLPKISRTLTASPMRRTMQRKSIGSAQTCK